MVSMETDVEELLALVINTGKQLDEQVIILIYFTQDFEYLYHFLIFEHPFLTLILCLLDNSINSDE